MGNYFAKTQDSDDSNFYNESDSQFQREELRDEEEYDNKRMQKKRNRDIAHITTIESKNTVSLEENIRREISEKISMENKIIKMNPYKENGPVYVVDIKTNNKCLSDIINIMYMKMEKETLKFEYHIKKIVLFANNSVVYLISFDIVPINFGIHLIIPKHITKTCNYSNGASVDNIRLSQNIILNYDQIGDEKHYVFKNFITGEIKCNKNIKHSVFKNIITNEIKHKDKDNDNDDQITDKKMCLECNGKNCVYNKDEYHCCQCDIIYKDKHCCQCKKIYKDYHCCICNEVYGEKFHHCDKCHITTSKEMKFCNCVVKIENNRCDFCSQNIKENFVSVVKCNNSIICNECCLINKIKECPWCKNIDVDHFERKKLATT